MCDKLDTYINDARNFQKHGQYDFAIDFLWKAKKLDCQHKYEAEIQKLLSFNHRKLGEYEQALIHINNAIRINSIEIADNWKKEYAICLMNKGIIFEELKRKDKVLECYLPALKIFTDLFDSDPDNYGVIINALMTIGMFYYKQEKFLKVKVYFEKALPYFRTNRESDKRYLTIINTLKEIQEKGDLV